MKKRVGMQAVLCWLLLCTPTFAAEITSARVSGDLSNLPKKPEAWKDLWTTAKEATIPLTAQPMAVPRPKETTTQNVRVKAIHDGKWIAFRLQWKAPQKSVGGRLGAYSDGAAIQFPVKSNKNPPPIFMGGKNDPVHIFHWRAQFQLDKERGLRTMKDLYPNMNPDMYPMEFKDEGHLHGLTDDKREAFSYGRAAGNPASYVKKGVDEIMAEGFGTSSVIQNVEAIADGQWSKGEWTLVISRPLRRSGGSELFLGGDSNMAFAVWQGAKDEVGGRKSVTMNWVPLHVPVK